MGRRVDVAIIGAGTMGSAAAYHLAKRGCGVIAFEQFQIVHEKGSHSGSTRIIRHAYHESPDYVPLVLRADQLWLDLEQQLQTRLLIRTGAVVMGPHECEAVIGAIVACERHSLPYEKLTAAAIRQRWPQFTIPADWEGCFDPMAGFLLVEPCIKSQIGLAARHGATIRENESVKSTATLKNGFRIETDKNTYEVDKIIVTAGAWTAHVLKELQLPLTVKRRTVTWLRPRHPNLFHVDKFPIFLADLPGGLLYGFPLYGSDGLKIANHHSRGPAIDPDSADRNYSNDDATDAIAFARAYLPGVSEEIVEGKVCLYNLTPDEDFILDFHPQNKNMLIASGFSGHGFKFAPVIGEIVADLCLNGKTSMPIDRFRISRFS